MMMKLPAALTAVAALFIAMSVSAKLPALSDEAKAKAAEAAAMTAHGNSVASFQLCKSMDKLAVAYYADAKKSGKDSKPAATTPPCADPGPFVYTPPAPAAGAAAAAPAATMAAAKPAAAAAATLATAPAAPAPKK